MSEKYDEKLKLSSKLKAICFRCLKGPNIIKTLIVIVCFAVVVEQLSTSINKLINVPVTTYTHFDFNQTLLYPSVTFCREPPYKFDKMQEYGLYAHPRYTSAWRTFNFSKVTLEALWDDITYTPEDFFVQYGLSSWSSNVEIIPVTGFVLGRCYTLSPRILLTKASKSTGYSITLQHSAEDIATSTSVYPPGYHVFIHYTKEPFTEVQVINGGFVDYLYIHAGEELDVKLTVNEYIKISVDGDICVNHFNYSTNNCTNYCVWKLAAATAGCSGPWMNSSLPPCSDHTGMRNLITAYLSLYADHDCEECARICRSFLYSAFVTNRQSEYWWDSTANQWSVRNNVNNLHLQTQFYLHFNSMMVSVYEEEFTYDWNIFVSDLGGSVGFLLGLSVISLMSICGKLWSTIVKPAIKPVKVPSISGSVIQNNKINDFIKKCNDWNAKNENIIKN